MEEARKEELEEVMAVWGPAWRTTHSGLCQALRPLLWMEGIRQLVKSQVFGLLWYSV
jgi:hypothetical protein